MAERKRRIVKTESTPMPDIEVFSRKEGVALINTIIRIEPSNDSPFVGALMAGDKVDIVDSSAYTKGWLKIKSKITMVEGYVDSKSIL